MEEAAPPRGGCLFCLSKARGQLPNAPPARQSPQLRLRAELGALKPGALSRRARAEGVDEERVTEALDCDDARAALIDLILEHSPAADEAAGTLRAELQGMRLKALKARAAGEGVGAEALLDADDADDVKEEVIRLILERAASRGPTERIRETLEAGGEAAAEMVGGVLEHASEVLEQQAVSSPRTAR